MNKKIKNEMKIEFASKSANEAFARIAVAAFVSQLDPTIEEIADIKTSVSEAVTNSIIHAYPNKDGIVKLKAILYDDEIEIEVSDTGSGIENIEDIIEKEEIAVINFLYKNNTIECLNYEYRNINFDEG